MRPATHSSPHRLLVTQHALRTIHDEALTGRRRGVECGGSLLAVPLPAGDCLIAYALPTGDRACQSWSAVTTDADHQNRWITRLAARHPNLTYIGDWHLHPMYLPQLSSTDLATCGEILADPDHGLEELFLLLATWAEQGYRFEVHAFQIRPAEPTRWSLYPGAGSHPARSRSIPFVAIADDDARVITALGGPLVALASLDADPGSARGWPADGPETSGGRGNREQAQPPWVAEVSALLQAGHPLEVRTLAAEQVALVLPVEGGRSWLLLPPEYPRAPPRVLWEDVAGTELVPLFCPLNWSSLHGLADVVDWLLGPGLLVALAQWCSNGAAAQAGHSPSVRPAAGSETGPQPAASPPDSPSLAAQVPERQAEAGSTVVGDPAGEPATDSLNLPESKENKPCNGMIRTTGYDDLWKSGIC